jgi:transposase
MSVSSSRFEVFTDEEWERIVPLVPSNEGRRGHLFGAHRRVVEGNAYRFRTGIPWRDLPREQFGPWQTLWKRPRRYAGDGTWDRVLTHLLTDADAAGRIDWNASVDATIARAHQHAGVCQAARARHRGLVRITRMFRWMRLNPQVTASDALAAG